jgi:hypothetical protein
MGRITGVAHIEDVKMKKVIGVLLCLFVAGVVGCEAPGPEEASLLTQESRERPHAATTNADLPRLPGHTYAAEILWEEKGERLVYLWNFDAQKRTVSAYYFWPEYNAYVEMWSAPFRRGDGDTIEMAVDPEAGLSVQVRADGAELYVDGQRSNLRYMPTNRRRVVAVPLYRGVGRPTTAQLQGRRFRQPTLSLLPKYDGCCEDCCAVHCAVGIPCVLDALCCSSAILVPLPGPLPFPVPVPTQPGACGGMCHCECGADDGGQELLTEIPEHYR